MIPVEYPAVLGSPVAGTVEALGPGVSKVAVGERVVCGTKVFVHKKAKYGGLQRFSIVDESEVIEVCPLYPFSARLAGLRILSTDRGCSFHQSRDASVVHSTCSTLWLLNSCPPLSIHSRFATSRQ